VIKLRFGYDSFTYHLSQVSAQGLPLRFFENEAIGLDIDEPQDLRRFLAFGRDDGETYRLQVDWLCRQKAACAGRVGHEADRNDRR
jgi:2-phospho-L-lactate guanylyltransferase (CobY/MobA/RfbA family)